MHLSRLSIRGYRRLFDIDVELRPFQVLIGVNGSGKTSVLEVLSLLAASARGQLGAKLSEAGGLSEVLTRDKADALELATAMPVPGGNPVEYRLRLEPQAQGYAIAEEHLTQDRGHPTPFEFIQATRGDRKYFDAGAPGLVPLPDDGWADGSTFETVFSERPTPRVSPCSRTRFGLGFLTSSSSASRRWPPVCSP